MYMYVYIHTVCKSESYKSSSQGGVSPLYDPISLLPSKSIRCQVAEGPVDAKLFMTWCLVRKDSRNSHVESISLKKTVDLPC